MSVYPVLQSVPQGPQIPGDPPWFSNSRQRSPKVQNTGGSTRRFFFVSNKTKVNGVVLSTGGAPGSGGRGRPAAVPVTGG